MFSDEAFSVFKEQNYTEWGKKDVLSKEISSLSESDIQKNTQMIDKMNSLDTDEISKNKKIKLSEQEIENHLIVTDSFETQGTFEVPKSSGLIDIEEHSKNGLESLSMTLSHQVRHQVALPANYNYIPISQHVPPAEPARKYEFKLDPFQQVAIASIEKNESVLVSAHTSAGKTVIAEYAIAQSLHNKQRVIYTSPIKALSNQKYRELLAEFNDVGLMTGDVTISPNASCLVMTTEILRSMLYRGSEVMREMAWVIFDEIHYMRDKERGVVWEETIILLPDKVRYVFLSATIPNAMQFAEWICKTHIQPCHVVYTDFRPTPLQHYIFPADGDGIHLVVDEKGTFREDNFQKAISVLTKKNDDFDTLTSKKSLKKKKTTKGSTKGPSDIYKIIKMIMVKNYNPVIVFSFSKRDCENLALQMSKLDMNDDSERDLISSVFNNAINSLSEIDRQLPQIQYILPLLRRGIGIHHSGLLPILKEVIEILFQEGLIKVLFATETFSIGLNMPAKTVVFTNVRKFDGKDFRWISSGEYIQMSGRAGRRRLDDRGIVILMIDEKMEPSIAKNMLKGEADRLESAFHLGYNMILNLMRVEGVSPEFMLEHSFYQFQNNAEVPKIESELLKLEKERDSIVIDDEANVANYYELRQQLDTYSNEMRNIINHPDYCLQFMQPGRLVRVKDKLLDFGWGAVVNYCKRISPKGSSEKYLPHESYIIDVLLWIAADSQIIKTNQGYAQGIRPPKGEAGKMEVIPVLLSSIDGIGHIRIFLPKDLNPLDQRLTVYKSIEEVKRRFPDGIALLDPIENMNIKDESFKNLLRKIEILEHKILTNPFFNSQQLPELYEKYARKMAIKSQIRETKKKISETQSIIQMNELKCRKRVLRRLGFTTSEDIIEMKGRVACEISTGDELILTEMIFNGVFNNLTSEQCAALLSCFVFQEKSEETPKFKEELASPLRMMQEIVRRIAKVSWESKLDIVEEEYINQFKPALMDVVYAWAQGKSFFQICKMTDVYEGSIIRAFRRLEELLRQMCSAAKVIGNLELETKMNNAITLIKRDIVFSASLYL
ncbi:hypothetical protein PCANB_000288 [Pneumocystis canis]|nr:hypothetical protein PCANB_000288 [Pneumocystis canis]